MAAVAYVEKAVGLQGMTLQRVHRQKLVSWSNVVTRKRSWQLKCSFSRRCSLDIRKDRWHTNNSANSFAICSYIISPTYLGQDPAFYGSRFHIWYLDLHVLRSATSLGNLIELPYLYACGSRTPGKRM